MFLHYRHILCKRWNSYLKNRMANISNDIKSKGERMMTGDIIIIFCEFF